MNNNVFTMIPGQNSLPLGKTEQNKFWSQKCVICDSFVTRHTKTSTPRLCNVYYRNVRSCTFANLLKATHGDWSHSLNLLS